MCPDFFVGHTNILGQQIVQFSGFQVLSQACSQSANKGDSTIRKRIAALPVQVQIVVIYVITDRLLNHIAAKAGDVGTQGQREGFQAFCLTVIVLVVHLTEHTGIRQQGSGLD